MSIGRAFSCAGPGPRAACGPPRELGSAEVEAFLTMLANERRVSPATHRQALNALLFLYRQVLGMDLPWKQQIGRPPERKRIPVVLTQDEIQRVLSMMAGEEAVLARLLYGAGLRLNEGLSLRGRTWTSIAMRWWCAAARATRTGW